MTVRILTGDCRSVLQALPAESVHCVVTSPPYFGLRDYGVAGQIGLEETPSAFVAEMVAVFREVRRVLRKDGTLWLNLGDSYNAYNGNRGASKGSANARHHQIMPGLPKGHGLTVKGLKNKDRLMIPARVALALQGDGWWLRDEIIWHKPNPMPASVTDRTTPSHEMLYMMSRSARYFYDAVAIKEPAVSGKADDLRNKRSVWTVPIVPFSEAHFATFPTNLIEDAIKAGCPAGGTVLDPFGGAGTTGLVANRLGRDVILIELNPAYAAMARDRIARDGGMFSQVAE